MDIKTLRENTERRGGLVDVTVRELRDAVGAGRAGHLVMAEIRRELCRYGLVYRPATLTADQGQVVTLALAGTAAGDLVIAGWRLARTASGGAMGSGVAA